MVHERKPDIISLPKMWLKNKKHLLEYVNISGHKFSYRNRNKKRGGGVGIFVKDCINCKVRNNFVSTDVMLGHLWK